MNFSFSPWRSLKTRITLLTLFIFLLSIWSLAFYASRMLHEETKRVIGEQQYSTASIVADQINDELNDRLRALEKIAKNITPAILNNTAELQTFLDQYHLFENLFNTGTFVTGTDGVAIASTPLSIGRAGANYMDRDYVIAALKEGKTTIGRPVIGKHQKTPVFSMATPIFNSQGMIIGALVGVTNLSKPNFLDKVANNRYGKTGGYILCAPQHKLIVTATDKKRIMQPTPAPGINPLYDRYEKGYEGFGHAVNSLGVEELTASKHIPVAGWFIVAKIPTSEAFAPIKTVQQQVFVATVFLTLLSGGLIWLMLRRQITPLVTAAKMLESHTDSDLPPQVLPVSRQDEIGKLIGGFNKLLESLGHREKALRENEERYRSLFSRAGDGIFILSTEGKLIDVNESMAKIHGYTVQEMLQLDLKSLDSPETFQQAPERFRRLLAGETLTFEVEHFHKDGHLFPLEVSSSLFSFGGESYVQCFHRDISERKRSEEVLQESRKQLIDIINFLPDATLAIDLEKRIIIWNHAIEKMTNVPAYEMLGKGEYAYTIPFYGVARPQLMDLVFEDDHELAAKYQNIVREGDSLTAEVFCPAMYNNRGAWIFVKAAPLRDQSGKIIGAIESIRDITERKQVEEERLQLQRQFFHAQKLESLGVLAGGIAHDFNNILTVILGYCYVAREESFSNEEYKAYFQRVETAGHRAADLCKQMLTYAGNSPIEQTRVNLSLLIEEVIKMLQAAIKENVAIELDLMPNVPEILGDSGQIQQVAMNLIINAAEAIADANGTIKVSLSHINYASDQSETDTFGTPIKAGAYVCLEVADTGIGMDEVTQKRIFEPFYTTKFTGRGLGMSAIRGIVTSHEALLHLNSIPGSGTSFKVCFPAMTTSHHTQNAQTETTQSKQVGGTVLLVEDEKILQDMSVHLLKTIGFIPLTSSNGREALETYRKREREIDLVMLDLIMPVMGGIEAYHELRSKNPKLPIIICSGYSVESVEYVISSDPRAEFMSKPYKPRELRDAIQRMIGEYRSHPER